jgi:hypothetical protein
LAHHRQGRAAVHEIPHMDEQAAAQGAAGMGAGEILGGEAAREQGGDRQGVAQRQRGRGAGRGGQVERAGFLGDAGIEVDVRFPAQGGCRVAGHADQLGAAPLDQGHDAGDFRALAGVGQGDHHVLAGDHAQVAMAGLGRVHEKRRGAGAGQGGGDLAADVTGFAHAGNHHPTLAGQEDVHRVEEGVVDAADQAGDGRRLDFQGAARHGQDLGGGRGRGCHNGPRV